MIGRTTKEADKPSIVLHAASQVYLDVIRPETEYFRQDYAWTMETGNKLHPWLVDLQACKIGF